MTVSRRQWLAQTLVGAATLSPARRALGDLPAATGNGWFNAAPLPLNVQELYPAVHKERLYVAGGIAARAGVPYFTDRCVSYDAGENAWRSEADLPEDLHHAALASTGSRLWLAGGFNGGYTHIWRMRDSVYSLTEGGWETGVNLPRPQAEGVFCASPAGHLHLVTGQSPTGAGNSKRSHHAEVREHLTLAEGAASWETLAPIPTARNSATGGWLGDQLVVTGGRTATGNLAVTEIYDSREDRWRSAAPMPKPQAGSASVAMGNALVVFGGEIFVPSSGVFADVWLYDLSRDQWQGLPALPTPRHGLGAGRLGNSIYVVGGATRPSGRGTSDKNEALLLDAIPGRHF